MERQLAQELVDCLPKTRTLFRYCRDYYAVQLLDMAVERQRGIAALKRSPFGRLLDKPGIKLLVAGCGNGELDPSVLANYWVEPSSNYLLTVGLWGNESGAYGQTSRPGFNLVLHLNFTEQHDRLMRRLLQPRWDGVFNYGGHPQLWRGDREYFRETLAWARLDIDFDNDEVLIEEIQSDWVRRVACFRRYLDWYKQNPQALRRWCIAGGPEQVREYLDAVEPHLRDWDQVMLAATIGFIRRELGVGRIWYHSWETGNCLKRIDPECGPPRSLYTRLPRQFCFERIGGLPVMLQSRRSRRRLQRKGIEPVFYRMTL